MIDSEVSVTIPGRVLPAVVRRVRLVLLPSRSARARGRSDPVDVVGESLMQTLSLCRCEVHRVRVFTAKL